MQEKISGPIREISLTQATYSNEKIKPTLINFFYGSNGTGKSTIARSIRENTGSTLDSNLRENTDILVYNQDFIDENFSNHQNLPGVFTLDSHNIEIENRINELQKEKDTLVKQLQLNSDTLSQAQKDSSKLEQLIQDTLWKESEEFRTEFDKIQKGYKIKKNFTDKVFKIKAEKAKDLEHLRQQYNIVFNEKAKKYPLLDNFEGETSYLDELANNSLIVDPIISSSNTSFALFAKKIKANDWIRSGYQMFHSNADNRCPYCQQELPDNFEAYIASCFDQQYEENIKQLKIILEKYRSYANQFVSPVMNINLDNTLEDTDLKKLSAEIRLLSNLIRENIQSMEQKIKEPSQSFYFKQNKRKLRKYSKYYCEAKPKN